MAEKGSHTVLVVDDDPGHRGMLEALLGRWGLAVTSAGDGKEAVARVCERPFDVVLMDIRMPDMDGITALKEIRKYNPAVPVVLMTAYSAVESAVEAMKSGAVDYLIKPLDFDQLKSTLFKTLEHSEAVRSGERFPVPVEGIVGNSPAVRRMLEMIHTVAPSEATVLINGKSGTGKELVARAIHNQSQRKDGPWVAVNCAALTESLLESELFGHEKGAFTGADTAKSGYFDLAKGGTLFLDEIGTMPHEVQSMLLRVLQENVYTPIGSGRDRISDVRVISATNEDMERAIKEGRFREDLYHRLNEFEIRQPSLEECPEDILPLAEFFRERFSKELKRQTLGFTEDAKRRMLAYRWPGNVRELQNRVKRTVLVSETPMLDMDGLETAVSVCGSEKTDTTAILPLKDEAFEKESIIRALKACNGHREQAAGMLNINPATLYRKMKKYGLK